MKKFNSVWSSVLWWEENPLDKFLLSLWLLLCAVFTGQISSISVRAYRFTRRLTIHMHIICVCTHTHMKLISLNLIECLYVCGRSVGSSVGRGGHQVPPSKQPWNVLLSHANAFAELSWVLQQWRQPNVRNVCVCIRIRLQKEHIHVDMFLPQSTPFSCVNTCTIKNQATLVIVVDYSL